MKTHSNDIFKDKLLSIDHIIKNTYTRDPLNFLPFIQQEKH